MSQVQLVTFADESMSRARELCVLSARHHGVDKVHEYQPSGVASAFIGHEAIWNNPKGCGLWAWKPMIINAQLGYSVDGVNTQLGHLTDGDILIYADAGVEFIAPVSHITTRMDHDVWLFGNNWEHAHWCKRDAVEAVYGESWLHNELREAFTGDYNEELVWERFGKQVQASVIFFRVSDWSRAFVAEWLKWCLHDGGRLIDDSPSRLPNHPEFQEHRHDQAILTTMAYREGCRLHYWPAVYNRGGTPEFIYGKLSEYAADDYPVLFHHHRRRDHEWKQ